jgi:hypothetical protein
MREDAGEFVILKHSDPIEAARGDRGDRGGNFSLDLQPAVRLERLAISGFQIPPDLCKAPLGGCTHRTKRC